MGSIPAVSERQPVHAAANARVARSDAILSGAASSAGATSAANASAEGPSAPCASSQASPAGAVSPLDDTAETVPDTATTLAEEIAQRAEVIMLAHQSVQQAQQAKLDRIRATFNATQEERSEMLREMNVLRDMAMEQSKKDDEILKKYIAMI